MPAGHLAYNFRRRLIVDAFVWDIPRCRLRRALDDDALYALVDRTARVVLVHLLAPHAGQLGLRGQGAHCGSCAALLGHSLGAGGLGFGNQALNSYLLVGVHSLEQAPRQHYPTLRESRLIHQFYLERGGSFRRKRASWSSVE